MNASDDLRPESAHDSRVLGMANPSGASKSRPDRHWSRFAPSRLASFRFAVLSLFLLSILGTALGVIYLMSERTDAVVYRLSSRIVDEIGEKVVARGAGIVRVTEGHLLSNAAVAAANQVIPGQAVYSDLFWQQVVFTRELTGMFIVDQAGNFVQARTEPEPSTRVIDRTVTPPIERIVVRDRDYQPLAHLERDPAFDPREQPWYRNTRPERRLQWTNAHWLSDSGRLGITATYPLLDRDDRILAVLGADLTLDSLADFLSRQNIGPNSAAFILDDRDRLIAYPHRIALGVDPANSEDLPEVNAIGIPWIKNALSSIGPFGASARSDQAYRSATDGQTYLAHVVYFGQGFGLPWRLVIVFNEADLLGEAQRAEQESIVLAAIIVLGALFILYPIAKTVTDSVEQLTRNTRLLRLFRPGEVVPVKSAFREISEMDQAICSMRDAMAFVESQLPTGVIRQLATGASQVELQAEFKTLTVMASALSNLDALFETLPPDQVVDFLHSQGEHGSAILTREDGTLDVFRGDRIHAFWDVPVAPEQAARHACRAALALSRSCDSDAANHDASGQVARYIGLHAGRGLVGNLGVAGRVRYSAMGRVVGVAARLRDANATYGTRIIISEAVHQEVKDRFICRALDVIRLPGDAGATPIYELRAETTSPPDAEELELIRLCALGLSKYRERAWDDAIAALSSARMSMPDDRACALLIARCELLRSGGGADLPADWDGALTCPSDPTIT
jgi:adenylate cyclase